MPPLSPVRAGESKKDRSLLKYRIININKRRGNTDEDKARHSALERVFIQRMSIQLAELERAHHAALERFHIQRMSIKAVELSRARHATL